MSYVSDDSQQVTIELSQPIGVLMNPEFPSSIKWGEPWMGTIDVVNVGSWIGYFQLRFTGDITGTSDVLVPLDPGYVFRFKIYGVGPREFQVHAEPANWEECAVVGLGVGPKVLGSEVVVEVGETVEGDIAEGELNGNILCNTGARSEWFRAVDAQGEMCVWLRAGLCYAHPRTPLFAYVARFSTTDSAAISVGHAGSYGCELRDLTIPRFGVDGGEQWEGSVEAWNIGTSTGTFRLAVTRDIEGTSDSFELGPGEHTLVTFAGTGITPNGFTATLQRMVDSEWMDGYSVDEKVGERITGYIDIRGYVDVPPVAHVPDPKAKVFLDGELVLDTSSLEWEPIHVASGRTYSLDVTSRGYVYWRGIPATWNEHRHRSYSYHLRHNFPQA